MGQNLYKKLTPGFKNHINNLDNFRQTVESLKKLKFNGLHLSKKYIPSAKTLYTEDLSSITFNYCENSPNFLWYFWDHKSFFTTKLVGIFLAETLHTFDRNIASKCTFSDFPMLELKFTKLQTKQNVRFSSKLGSFFSVMREKSSALF